MEKYEKPSLGEVINNYLSSEIVDVLVQSDFLEHKRSLCRHARHLKVP